MKTKHIMAFGLLAVLVFGGCSQDNAGIESHSGVSAAPTQATASAMPTEDSAAQPQEISFSAGKETTPSTTVTVKPTATPQAMEKPIPAATPKSTVRPKAAETPKPTVTPNAEETPAPAVDTAPVEIATAQPATVSTPAPTAAPTPVPTPAPTPEPTPSAARTICNICGADITGNVPAHGDSHLLNGEDFSYRVE